MTDKVTSPSDSAIITQLTAYLDGELETDEVRDVEERISNDNRYQKLLHQLQQTWDVLDVLPSAEISAARDFTQSTMKLVVQDAKKLNGKKQKSFWIWPLRILVLLLIPCTAATGTYVASRYFQNIPVRQFEQNISLIRDFDALAYDKNLSVEFLERLDDEGDLFSYTVKPSEHMEQEMKLNNNQFLVELDSFSAVQRQRIRDNFNGFRKLSTQETSRIQALHEQISNHARKDQLLLTLRRYYQFLQIVGETETAEILDTNDSDEKINLIKTISLATYDESFGREGPTALPEADNDVIYLYLITLIANSEKQSIMNDVILDSAADAQIRLDQIEYQANEFYKGSLDHTIFKNGQKLKLFHELAPEKIDELITANDVDSIKQRFLSDDALAIMDETIHMEANVGKSDAQLLVQWMIEEFEKRFPAPGSPTTIEQVYQNLKPKERDKIDNEHPADRRRLLEQKLKEMREW